MKDKIKKSSYNFQINQFDLQYFYFWMRHAFFIIRQGNAPLWMGENIQCLVKLYDVIHGSELVHRN